MRTAQLEKGTLSHLFFFFFFFFFSSRIGTQLTSKLPLRPQDLGDGGG